MPLIDFLEKMREKPEPAKRKITLLASIIFTILIFAVWLSFGGLSSEKKKEENVAYSPFSVFKDIKNAVMSASVAESLNSIKGAFREIKENINQIKEYKNNEKTGE